MNIKYLLEIPAKIYSMGTKGRLADCIKEASKFQVASLQVATLNRLAVCEFECEKLTFLAVL